MFQQCLRKIREILDPYVFEKAWLSASSDITILAKRWNHMDFRVDAKIDSHNSSATLYIHLQYTECWILMRGYHQSKNHHLTVTLLPERDRDYECNKNEEKSTITIRPLGYSPGVVAENGHPIAAEYTDVIQELLSMIVKNLEEWSTWENSTAADKAQTLLQSLKEKR